MNSVARAAVTMALWFAASAAGFAALTQLDRFAVTDPAAFFPADSPQRIAREAIERSFPGAAPLSQAVLVVEADSVIGARGAELAALADTIRNLDTSGVITAVLAPTDNRLLEKRLVAPSGHAALIVVQLDAGFASSEGGRIVERIERVAAAANNPGFTISLSGDATLGRDYDRAIDDGGRRSALATIAFVTVILLLIYRSVVAAGISLVTLAAALGLTFGVTTLLAAFGVDIAYQSRPFIVAIVYGVGTDYFLLYFSRAMEDRAAGSSDPTSHALTATAPVIAFSAFAVAVACLVMKIADFGLFSFSGVPLAVGVICSMAAAFSLAPLLLRSFARRLPASSRGESGMWSTIARAVIGGPVVAFAIPLVVLLPLIVAGLNATPTYENEIDIPADTPSAAGYDALTREFSLAATGPAALVIRIDTGSANLPEGWNGMRGLAEISVFSAKLASLPGVRAVYSAARPDGNAGTFESGSIRGQLAAISDGLQLARGGANAIADGLGSAGRDAAAAGKDIASGLGGALVGVRTMSSGLRTARREIDSGLLQIERQLASVEKDRHGSLAALMAAHTFDQAANDLKHFRRNLERLRDGLDKAIAGAELAESGLAQGLARAGETEGDDPLADLARALDGARAIDSGLGRAFDRLAFISSLASTALDELALAPHDLDDVPVIAKLMAHYVGDGGRAALFEIEFDSPPNSPAATATLARLKARTAIWCEERGMMSAEIFAGGPTAITSDLAALTSNDLRRIGLVIVLALFLLLLVLLRDLFLSAAVSLYLLASYFASIGLLRLLADAGMWPGIDWKAPFFLFVLLVAIGADYGIFLLGRAREEAASSDFVTGLSRALIRTGPIITSCGLVLAGTFAALALSPIAFLQQVGIGVTAGVLIDTLVVRPFMLPSTALLLRRIPRVK